MVAFVMLVCFLVTSFGWLYESFKATEKQVEEEKSEKRENTIILTLNKNERKGSVDTKMVNTDTFFMTFRR